MLRTLHLSDFHLNKRTLHDWNDYLQEALYHRITEINSEIPIDLIAYTGDLVDQAGKELGGLAAALEQFREHIVNPTVAHLKLQPSRFFMIPGNHDVDRNLDFAPTDDGLKRYFADKNNIVDFVKNVLDKDWKDGIKRIGPYSEFIREHSKGTSNLLINELGYAQIFLQGDKKIGVACLNSSWRCYSKDGDIGHLLVGEEQLNRMTKFLKPADIRIALIHHPLDWLSPVERDLITSHLTLDFHILLNGHVHNSHSSISTGFTGSLFTNTCPSGLNDIRTTSSEYSNGFSVVDYDYNNGSITCRYYKYVHQKKAFVLNTEICKDGVLTFQIPSRAEVKKEEVGKKCVATIGEEYFAEMDKHIISANEDGSSKSLLQSFVLPPIEDGLRDGAVSEGISLISVNDILKSNDNVLFCGPQESGKTTLLYRLVIEFCAQFELQRKVPVYIEFKDIEHTEISSLIKKYLLCSTKDLNELLTSNQLVLLIDNVDFTKSSNNHALSRLHKFFSENALIRLLCAARTNLSGFFPEDYILNSKIPYHVYFVKNLRSKEIKSLIQNWMPSENVEGSNRQLDKLVRAFTSYSLPSNPMSVTLFLWSVKYSDRKPVNNAVLLEIYIQIALEQMRKENIYRETFDFTNKIQLISNVAYEMHNKSGDEYVMTKAEFVATIDNYITRLVGHTFDSNRIADYLIDRRIFVLNGEKKISFAHPCFLHFFLAKRMIFDSEFRASILQETTYHRYHSVIDYYSGLVRSDKKLLELVLNRAEEKFRDADFIFERNYDDYFVQPEENIAEKLDVDAVESKRSTPAAIEEHYNQLLKDIPEPKKIFKSSEQMTLEHLLLILSNVLRNSEGVEDLELKKRAYYSLVKFCLAYIIIHREQLIAYVRKHKKIPPSIGSHVGFREVVTYMPYFVQGGMAAHAGSHKLASVIAAKIGLDYSKKGVTSSDVEKFLSVALYADIQGPEFEKVIRRLLKSTKNNLVVDMLVFRLMEYYELRAREDSDNERMYLELLTYAKIKANGLPRRLKKSVTERLKKWKRSLGTFNP